MKKLLITAAVSVCVSTSAMATTLTDTFSSFVVLGDSLSDNGNLFGAFGAPPAPFFDGRFSNGPVWNEAIGAEFPGGLTNPLLGGSNDGAVNLSFGGARADNDPNTNGPVPSVQSQVGAFLSFGGTFQPDTLVSVWAGANDIFQDLPFDTGTAVGTETAGDVSARLGELVGLGAKNLLVFNLPDFGVVPRFAADPLVTEASEAITAYNALLGASLDALELMNPDVNVFRVDVFSIFNDIIADPAAFGFANVTDACLFTACILGDKALQDTFLFWDDVHPTEGGHRLIEAAARQALAGPSAVPLPAGAPLLIFALVGLRTIARRHR